MHGRHTWLIDASVHKETRVRWPSIRRFITWMRQPIRAFVVHHESPSRCDQSESVEYPTVGIHYPFRRRRGDFVGGIPRRSFGLAMTDLCEFVMKKGTVIFFPSNKADIVWDWAPPSSFFEVWITLRMGTLSAGVCLRLSILFMSLHVLINLQVWMGDPCTWASWLGCCLGASMVTCAACLLLLLSLSQK